MKGCKGELTSNASGKIHAADKSCSLFFKIIIFGASLDIDSSFNFGIDEVDSARLCFVEIVETFTREAGCIEYAM